MKILVNFCIRDLDRDELEPCAAETQEEVKHVVRKFRGAVSMKISVGDSKKCITAVELRVSVRGGELMRREAFDPTSFKKRTHRKCILRTRADKGFVYEETSERKKKKKKLAELIQKERR